LIALNERGNNIGIKRNEPNPRMVAIWPIEVRGPSQNILANTKNWNFWRRGLYLVY
jgi:hypothetical protein